ncbi:GIY-YIG nuclease family protein [Streptomyces sp. NPDC058316]|uniref:GIY-YIG nuclease family protein n=1 Tax=Streptomyces sp. NPDC058316 TaxID=3346442 RepID=UPI0036E5C4CE
MANSHPRTGDTPPERPIRFYIWPDEWGLWSSPLGGWHYEPTTDDPRILEPVRRLTEEEIAAEEAAKKRALTEERKRRSWPASTGLEVRTALYRLRDDAGQLLYIGISEDPLRRWPEHAKGKSWWPKVVDLSLEWFASRDLALTAEVAAIRSERPLHNVVHNWQQPAA